MDSKIDLKNLYNKIHILAVFLFQQIVNTIGICDQECQKNEKLKKNIQVRNRPWNGDEGISQFEKWNLPTIW